MTERVVSHYLEFRNYNFSADAEGLPTRLGFQELELMAKHLTACCTCL
jgi:hypothetical protein